jgi:LuxR family maltose regulon positive regulatory protein
LAAPPHANAQDLRLLTTKLYIPPVRPELVSRPRLIQRLNAHLDRKLTLISAPAGFGKTTLLSEWAASMDRPVAWVSLDKGDEELTRFWSYLITALQRMQPDIGATALLALRSRQPPLMDPLLTGLINEIASMSQPFVLFLDDVHVIANQQIHDGLTFLLDNLPPQMHLILSSRSDPPWPLARLRARGEMTELRASDLRFSEHEAAAFLNEVMKLDLSADDVAKLEDRTEGWIVGLQMAALSMRSRKDGSAFIAAFTGTHRFILDYLVEEVLDQQSPAIQEFLLQTSILERLTAPLCDAVTDGQDSQIILTELEQANLFLVPLDDERRWYRYHHLFADLLGSRLEQTQPDQVPTLHLRASEWYEENRLIPEAVQHALAAGDVKRAAHLVEGNALAMVDHGELTTLLGWLAALPEEVLRSRPWLCIAHAWALAFAGRLDAVEPKLEDAQKALPSEAEGLRSVLRQTEGLRIAGHVAAIRAYVAALGGDMPHATALGRVALEHLPEEDLITRGFAAGLLSTTLRWSGDLVAATQAAAEAVAAAGATGDSLAALGALATAAALQSAQGQLHKAVATCWDVLALADQSLRRGGQRLPVAGEAHVLISTVLREWNDLQAALRHAREAVQLYERWGWAEGLAFGHRTLARALQAIGDIDGAREATHKARQAARDISPWFDAHEAAMEAKIRLALGDVAAASRWMQQSGLRADGELHFRHLSRYVTLARVLIAQGGLDEASDLLARLLAMTEAAGARTALIQILVLQAIVLQAQGEMEEALTVLERALTLAEPEGYVRTFIDEGAPMGTLLRQAQARGIQSNYARKLLAAWEGETQDQSPLRLTKTAPPSLVHRPSSPLIEPLTERELEVLRLLPTRLSSTGIGEQLYVSVHTVRSHIKSIYAKLNVHRRIDAIQRAKDLGLL